MTHITCRLTAKNRNPTLGNRVWATFTFIKGDVIMCRQLVGMAPTLRDDVLRSNQSKGVALIEHLQRPAAAAAAGKTAHQLPAALFVTKTHLEIFGLVFPLALADLPSAVTLVSDLYLHANITTSLRPSIRVVNKSRGSETSWPQVWRHELDTLTR